MEIKEWTEAFNTVREKDVLSRDMSYDICREFFLNNCNDPTKVDEIALHLYAFLASWGMLRNSFLLSKNYRFLIPVIRKLCEHTDLKNWEPKFTKADDDTIEDIIRLKEEIIQDCLIGQTFYAIDAEKKIIQKVTDTLVSKIMLGTLGCVPAYDSYFVRALKGRNLTQTFSKSSLKEIVAFANGNGKESCEAIKKSIADPNSLYTTMRIVDMLLWWEGYELIKMDRKEKKKDL